MLIESIDTRKVILVTPAPISHRTAEENLGLGYLAAMLRKNSYQVEIVDGWLEKLTPWQVADRIIKLPLPLFIGFSAYRSNMERAMETVHILRSHGCNRPVVAGGFGPTFHPSEFLQAGFDLVIRGEAEQAIVDLASYYKTGQPSIEEINGASFIKNSQEVHTPIRPLVLDIDTIPFPARDTIHLVIARKTPLHVVSARGCQAHCLFCSIVAFQKLGHGPQWRQRSISNLVDELDQLAQQGATHFKVIDDSLIEAPRDDDWCKQLSDEIERRGLTISLRGSIRADRLDDNILRELKRAGFISFSCGIENFSQTALTRMNKTATRQHNLQALELFEKHNLIMQQGMILFDYGTTMGELEENYWGMRHYDHTVIKGVFTEMYAADGTPFTKLLDKKGLLERDQSIRGNHRYLVLDPQARLVYKVLKTWHKDHAYTYDMAIDPVSAPKALTQAEFNMFIPLVREIRHKDLDFMRLVMDMVHQGTSLVELSTFTQEYITLQKPWYDRFHQKVEAAYRIAGLVYDADENPFIC